jgi:hypothetical protein
MTGINDIAIRAAVLANSSEVEAWLRLLSSGQYLGMLLVPLRPWRGEESKVHPDSLEWNGRMTLPRMFDH